MARRKRNNNGYKCAISAHLDSSDIRYEDVPWSLGPWEYEKKKRCDAGKATRARAYEKFRQDLGHRNPFPA